MGDRFHQFLRFDRLRDMHPKSGSMGLLPIDLLHKTEVLRELVRGFERKIAKSTEMSYKLGIKWNLLQTCGFWLWMMKQTRVISSLSSWNKQVQK